MKTVSTISLAIVLIVLVLSGYAAAIKPEDIVRNSNGFLSGHHYNLNIHGKKDTFACPEPEYDALGNPKYGNSIFVPENGLGIQILMQSDRRVTVDKLAVIDPCTAAFDGTAAVIQIPYSRKGYFVFARPLGKPTDNPTIQITPDLLSIMDASGNDLVYLGMVTKNGFQTPYATLTRTKGKSKAVDITGLFQFSGPVCYLTADYCIPVESCTLQTLCCTDADLNGVYESCVTPITPATPTSPAVCPVGSLPISAYCKEYVSEWIFNIGDLVDYLWNVDNQGVKLLQIRFYPVPE